MHWLLIVIWFSGNNPAVSHTTHILKQQEYTTREQCEKAMHTYDGSVSRIEATCNEINRKR